MRFLFTTFEGGGHVAPALLVARRLQERGHEILFVSDSANAAQTGAFELPFESWKRAPNRTSLGQTDDPLDEWRSRWPPAIVRRLCDAVITGPSAAYAQDLLDFTRAFCPDLTVCNELLFGVMAGCEAIKMPLVLLSANVWCFPTRADIPPFGPGFHPSKTWFARHRDEQVRRMSAGWYQAGLPALNFTRSKLGLSPLRTVLEQLNAVDLIILGTASSFDYDVQAPPGFLYAGPLMGMPALSQTDGDASLLSGCLPNLLIALSTAPQGQESLLQRCVTAAASLPVNVIVTLGPALRGARLPLADNTRIVAAAPHDAIMPHCSAVISQGGHGTIVRALMHGVPLLCLPKARDQPENTARVLHAGAGIRAAPSASVPRLKRNMQILLEDGRYTCAARRLGAKIRREADEGAKAANALEQLAIQRRRMT